MGVNEGTAQLDKAMKLLLKQWEEARALWKDAAAEKFQQEQMDPLQLNLKRAMLAMEHIAKVVASMRHECE